jgi:hypothetical protein
MSEQVKECMDLEVRTLSTLTTRGGAHSPARSS